MASTTAPSRWPLREAKQWRIGTRVLATFTYLLLLATFDQVRHPGVIEGGPPWSVLALLSVGCLNGAVYCRFRSRRSMRLAVSKYGADAVAASRAWWGPYARTAGRFLAVFTLALLPLITTPKPEFPSILHPPLWLVMLWVLASLGIVLLTAALLSQGQETSAQRDESAEELASVVRPRSAQLADELMTLLGQLQDISDRVRLQEEFAKVLQRKYGPVMADAMMDPLQSHDRKAFRQQLAFISISFLLGFIVNWLSSPTLEAIRRVLRI